MADQKLDELTLIPNATVATDLIYVVRDGVDYKADIANVVVTPTAHATSHQNGGADEISVAGLSGELADPQPPKDHDHASNKLAQSNTHESPDTDTAPTALHHTLGTGANQAAAGNHNHSGVYEPVQTAASQAEMEAGTETAIRSMTPQRVAQAIAALAGGGGAVTLAQSTAQTGPVNTTDETAIFSFTLPTDLVAGDVLQLVIFGKYLNNSGAARSTTMRVKLGATTMLSGSTSSVGGSASPRAFYWLVTLSIVSTSSQKVGVLGRMTTTGTVPGALLGFSTGSLETGGYGVSSEDITSAKTFQVTAQPDAANASHYIYAESAVLIKHPAP